MMPVLEILFGSVFASRSRGKGEAVVARPLAAVQFPVPLTFHDFVSMEIPERGHLIEPIIPERSLSMVYAPRGIGKSWFALSLGLAVASGTPFLKWKAPERRKVLFVDGENLLADLKARLVFLAKGLDIPPGNFQVLAADSAETGIDLSTAVGQRALEAFLDGIDVLILDNLSTLIGSGSEGAGDAWLPLQNWLLGLRRKGIAVLLVHHAGVNGRQRGTSRREDALDTVIALRRPSDYSAEQGARFEVHLEKTRTMVGEAGRPFEAAIEQGPGGICWVVRELEGPILERAAALFAGGMSVREVGAILSVSRSEAGRLRLRAIAEKLFDPALENEREGDGAEAVEADLRPN